MVELRVPASTYRLQLSRDFGFEDARAVVPYLKRLGISDVYTSPILRARPGSAHGYDVIDPTSLNPELGTADKLEQLVGTLRANDMGLLLDIVPNHVAASPDNPWWLDVLENGPVSPYASFFDIQWTSGTKCEPAKLVLPILDKPYGEALRNGEIVLSLEERGLAVIHGQTRLPVDSGSYGLVVSHCLSTIRETGDSDDITTRQLTQLLESIGRLAASADRAPAQASEVYRQRQQVKEAFTQLTMASGPAWAALANAVARFNSLNAGSGHPELLGQLLGQQIYELAFWRTGLGRLNYRRFFDISDLVGVRVEEPAVLEATHALVWRLASEGKVTGLRIDHIDGLRDPLEYLDRLQQNLAHPRPKRTKESPGFYVIVEKILSGHETLPGEWPVCGTTGYDFLNDVSNLFVDAKGARQMGAAYSAFVGATGSFADVVYAKKVHVIHELFVPELRRLAGSVPELRNSTRHRHVPQDEMARAIAVVTACLPVYRTYVQEAGHAPQDRQYVERAFHEAERREPGLNPHALAHLQRVLSLDLPADASVDEGNQWLDFVMRWQQFTGPAMAKGFEDTALYCYSRLISQNEVGGDPGATGMSIEEFHQANLERQARSPSGMNATSTHDTKRSEDVRARINVISENPEEWRTLLFKWHRWNEHKRRFVNREPVPEPAMEAFLYQTLIGAWPLSAEEAAQFRDRLKAYAVKAAREAKERTSWLSPDPDYEKALLEFLDSILDDSGQNRFPGDFQRVQAGIAYCGALNSLGQVLLKATSPGVPDFYQGQELWDFSLADPDNRRAVDFVKRTGLLEALARRSDEGQARLAPELVKTWRDGRIKLYVTYKALNVRRAHREVFLGGRYVPLYALGKRRDHVCAFARRRGRTWVMTAVPRFVSHLVRAEVAPVGYNVWGDDVLRLPKGSARTWTNAFTGETIQLPPQANDLPLREVFARFPLALLVATA